MRLVFGLLSSEIFISILAKGFDINNTYQLQCSEMGPENPRHPGGVLCPVHDEEYRHTPFVSTDTFARVPNIPPDPKDDL
jgi:hypothetical protein